MIPAEKGQNVCEDDGKLLHKDARILGPAMRKTLQGRRDHDARDILEEKVS
jgi:hypothetical protein